VPTKSVCRYNAVSAGPGLQMKIGAGDP
jgi:hypothetical protein